MIVTLSRGIEIRKEDLDDQVLEAIKEELSFPNVEKDRAKREHQGGWWKMPDQITAYWEFDDAIFLPRGFTNPLLDGLDELGIEYNIQDERVALRSSFLRSHPVDLRDYQETAIDAMESWKEGIWQAPPGAGKTVTVLEFARRLGLRTLVVVDKTNIAEQWRERAAEHIGVEMGLVGDGVHDERDFTIAMQQTLWAKREELEEDGFFERWGFVCLDECHHFPAQTFTNTLQRFPAKYRIGVSGTPAKKWHHLPIMEVGLGPIFHVTPKEELRRKGWLVKPKVIVRRTQFEADFFPTHRSTSGTFKGCQFPGCTRDQKKILHRNNYSDIIKDLVDNDERNLMIARDIAKEVEIGRCCLVLSKRLKHLKTLRELVASLCDSERLWDFTGKQDTEERMKIQAEAESGSCALFATVADEALDIPRADAVFLTFPTRNTGTIRQQIGRIERPHRNKMPPLIYDYCDYHVGVMEGQFSDRVNDVYKDENLEVVYTGKQDD